MEILGYIAAILIGLSLGLIGGGGSILTIPILVYLLGVEAAETAPAYSLFVVGIASLIGAIIKYKQGFVELKTAVFFGIPTIIAIFLTRKFLVPAIPNNIITMAHFEISKRIFIMGIFSIIMIVAAVIMIKGRKTTKPVENMLKTKNHISNFLGGFGIGGITGLVGAGGGFMIIPALIKIGNLNMKTAVGTSLAIIAMNSFFGFLGSIGTIAINWELLLPFTALAGSGIFIGTLLSKKIDGSKLKVGFGYFVLVMGLFILTKEIFLN